MNRYINILLAISMGLSIHGAHHPYNGALSSSPLNEEGLPVLQSSESTIEVNEKTLLILAKRGFSLVKACIEGNEGVFLDHPEWVDAQDADGNTVLHLAVKAGHLPCFTFLVNERGADCTIENKVGETVEKLIIGKKKFEDIWKARKDRRVIMPVSPESEEGEEKQPASPTIGRSIDDFDKDDSSDEYAAAGVGMEIKSQKRSLFNSDGDAEDVGSEGISSDDDLFNARGFDEDTPVREPLTFISAPAISKWEIFRQTHPETAAFVQALQSYEQGDADVIQTTFQDGLGLTPIYDSSYMPQLKTLIRSDSTLMEAFLQVHSVVQHRYPAAFRRIKVIFDHYFDHYIEGLDGDELAAIFSTARTGIQNREETTGISRLIIPVTLPNQAAVQSGMSLTRPKTESLWENYRRRHPDENLWEALSRQDPDTANFVYALQSLERMDFLAFRNGLQGEPDLNIIYDASYMPILNTHIRPNSTLLAAFFQVHRRVEKKDVLLARSAFERHVEGRFGKDVLDAAIAENALQEQLETGVAAPNLMGSSTVVPILSAIPQTAAAAASTLTGSPTVVPVSSAIPQTAGAAASTLTGTPTVVPTLPAFPSTTGAIPSLSPTPLVVGGAKRKSIFTPTRVVAGLAVFSLILVGKAYYDHRQSKIKPGA